MASQIAASLAANPSASLGAYGVAGSGVAGTPIANTTPMGSQIPAPPGTLTTADWQNLIAGDAGLQSAEAALSGSQAADQNALGAELTNAYESFGKPVDLATLASQLGMTQADIQNYLGPDAQKIAQENTDAGTSTVARLDQANQNATRAILAGLNKRGLLNSGETGYQLDQQNLGYRQAQQDAYSKFLGYLQQYQQGYLAAQQQRAAALVTAINSAADRQYNLNQSPPAAPPSDNPPTDDNAPPAAPPAAPAAPPAAPAAPAYDPNAYVPGGSSPAVAKAIQALGYAKARGALPNAYLTNRNKRG